MVLHRPPDDKLLEVLDDKVLWVPDGRLLLALDDMVPDGRVLDDKGLVLGDTGPVLDGTEQLEGRLPHNQIMKQL